MMHRALFLDRDGVINIDHGYTHKIADIIWVDGIFELARAAYTQSLKLIIITNQAGIARGLFTDAQFHLLMNWMRAEFAREGAPLTDVYYCPYHPDGIGDYARASPRRKPAPGMILDAERDHQLDLVNSCLIGDRESDIVAGHAAGVGHLGLFGPTASVAPAGAQRLPTHAASLAWLRGIYAA